MVSRVESPSLQTSLSRVFDCTSNWVYVFNPAQPLCTRLVKVFHYSILKSMIKGLITNEMKYSELECTHTHINGGKGCLHEPKGIRDKQFGYLPTGGGWHSGWPWTRKQPEDYVTRSTKKCNLIYSRTAINSQRALRE